MDNIEHNRQWHWIFWGIYFCITHVMFSNTAFDPFDLLVSVIFLLHNIGAAYIIIDYWIPRLIKKKQYILFLVVVFTTCMVFSGFLMLSLIVLFKTIARMEGGVEFFIETMSTGVFWSPISSVTLILIPYFVLQRKELDRRHQQLEKEKLATELNFLKSQLHPHFLFNALNNIYFLIKKDPDTAAEALAGFSNLLRFQLYEAKHPLISLDKEINYLQQFAEIAQLRKGENFQVNWHLSTTMEGIEIPPLLLMPLIENAFKHGSNKNGSIDIELSTTEDTIFFKMTNTKEQNKSQGLQQFEEHGIGLDNIKKRLALLYPNQHELNIQEKEEKFEVSLRLPYTRGKIN